MKTKRGKRIYAEIKDLPIIDYHCHLNETAIRSDKKFENIGERVEKGIYSASAAIGLAKKISYENIKPALLRKIIKGRVKC